MTAPAHCLPRRRRTRSAQRGVALIEVLVALLIFMVGVLGLVGMQTTMTRTQTDSKVRADAAYLASEVVGRMWADIGHLPDYEGDTNCTSTSCTQWRTKVAQVLPGGGAAITVDEDTGDVSVTVTWTMPGGDVHKYMTQTTILSKGAG